MGEAGVGPALAAADWAAIRGEYEAGGDTVDAIAQRHGVTDNAIFRRRRAEGWVSRVPKRALAATPGRTPLSGALKTLVAREIAALRARLTNKATDDETRLKRIQATAQALAKILDIENKERSHEPEPAQSLPIVDDACLEEIAECLERLQRGRLREEGSGGGEAAVPGAAA